MNVSEINSALLSANLDTPGLFPHLEGLAKQPFIFRASFGLDTLPREPGVIMVRGARQYGKSTWLEQQLRQSAAEFGPASSLYLNGDELRDERELAERLGTVASLFDPKAVCRRLFVDEVTAVSGWQRALKHALDSGTLRSVLVVTTGSKATDLRRGAERLPGRKGRLDRTVYHFTPLPFGEFRRVCGETMGPSLLPAYLLAGGCPVACAEVACHGRLPEFVTEMTRDWIYGECSAAGRDRSSMLAVLQCIASHGGSPLGQANLARETGLANNTVAAGYVELLHDLMCVASAWAWDHQHGTLIRRKPAKYHFTNLLAASSFHRSRPRHPADLGAMADRDRGAWREWAVAQELWRRSAVAGEEFPELQRFWQSKEHEIDFVTSSGELIEAKSGAASPGEFAWVPQVFPGKRLTVVCDTPFETHFARGITLEQFLAG